MPSRQVGLGVVCGWTWPADAGDRHSRSGRCRYGPSDMDLPRGRQWLWIALAAAVVVAAAVLAVSLTSPDGTPAAAPPSTVVMHTGASAVAGGFACAARTDEQPDQLCERRANDHARRKPLTPQQQAEISGTAQQIQAILPPVPQREQACVTGSLPCQVKIGPIDADYVAAAWAALFRAGYKDAVVRLAHVDDPAPQDSMVYGVPVGPGCVVGYVSTRSSSHSPAGLLSEGGCLTK